MIRHDYTAIMDAAGRTAAMAACSRDINNLLREYWDCFAIADFYNSVMNKFGTSWKCVRWTSNNEIMVAIIETWTNNVRCDVTFMAKYDEQEPCFYKSATYITHKQNK